MVCELCGKTVYYTQEVEGANACSSCYDLAIAKLEAAGRGLAKQPAIQPPPRSMNTKERILWLVWGLLPFPMLTALILPVGLLFAYSSILPNFFGIWLFPEDARSFPSLEQIHSYGLEFYRILLSQSMTLLVLSTAFWIANLLLFRRALKILSDDKIDKDSTWGSSLYGLGFTLLSVFSGFLLFFAVAVIG